MIKIPSNPKPSQVIKIQSIFQVKNNKNKPKFEKLNKFEQINVLQNGNDNKLQDMLSLLDKSKKGMFLDINIFS